MAEETREERALAAATEAVKLTLGLATGALVFSAGLLKEDVQLGHSARCLMAWSWGLLSLAIIAGTLAYLRVPVKTTEGNYDLHDPWFAVPGVAHHLSFLAGMVALGLAMVDILFGRP